MIMSDGKIISNKEEELITFKEKLTLINGSIDKWDEISKGLTEDRGRMNCSLCLKYNFGGNNCKGCPICEKTGQTGCTGTPYDEFRRLSARYAIDNFVLKGEISSAAKDFRDWLKDLYIEVSEAGSGGDWGRLVEKPKMSDTQKLSERISNLVLTVGSSNMKITSLAERIEKLEEMLRQLQHEWVLRANS